MKDTDKTAHSLLSQTSIIQEMDINSQRLFVTSKTTQKDGPLLVES